MNKYKITYSVTIEAESQQDAINTFFDSVPRGGDLQCSLSQGYDITKSLDNDMKYINIVIDAEGRRFKKIVEEIEKSEKPGLRERKQEFLTLLR